MKLWKRNAVVAAIVLFVCVAVYLNWSYNQESEDTGKVLGQAALVGGQSSDPLLTGESSAPQDGTPAPQETAQQTGVEGESGGYFDQARLNRQQARDSALSILQQTVTSQDSDQTMKDEAGQAIQTLADYTVSEAQIENLITAKGYADCVAFLSDESASVVVSAQEGGLTDADIARISEIVMAETGLEASQIKIVEAQG
mgnify:CR=1 FL=1